MSEVIGRLRQTHVGEGVGSSDRNNLTGHPQISMPGGPRGIVFSADGSAAYVANYVSGSIAVVDVATPTIVRTPLGTSSM